MPIFSAVVSDGQQALAFNRGGRGRLVVGPRRVSLSEPRASRPCSYNFVYNSLLDKLIVFATLCACVCVRVDWCVSRAAGVFEQESGESVPVSSREVSGWKEGTHTWVCYSIS